MVAMQFPSQSPVFDNKMINAVIYWIFSFPKQYWSVWAVWINISWFICNVKWAIDKRCVSIWEWVLFGFYFNQSQSHRQLITYFSPLSKPNQTNNKIHNTEKHFIGKLKRAQTNYGKAKQSKVSSVKMGITPKNKFLLMFKRCSRYNK